MYVCMYIYIRRICAPGRVSDLRLLTESMKFTGGRLATGLLAIPSMNNNEFTVPGW